MTTMTADAVICGVCRVGIAHYRLARRHDSDVLLCSGCALAAQRADRRAAVTRLEADTTVNVSVVTDSLFPEMGGRLAEPKIDTVQVRAPRPESAPHRPDVTGQRSAALDALAVAGRSGLLAEQVAAELGISPNQAAARLGELWELGRAAVLRTRGICGVGACYDGDGRHRPHEPCDRHGPPVRGTTTHGRAAAIWVLTR